MQHVIEYRPGFSFMDLVDGWEQKITRESGRAVDLENSVNYQSRNREMWLNYTLVKTECQFSTLNSGNWFPYKFDHRHDVNLGLTYKVTPHIKLTTI